MNYRGTDKDGKKYFIEIRGKHVIISSDNGVLDLTTEDFYGYDKNGRAVFENDTIILPKGKSRFHIGDITLTAKGQEVVVPNITPKASFTRGMLAQVIQHSELKTIEEK